VSEFDRPIGRVWRRMRAQRFLTALVWCLGGTLAAAAIALGAARLLDRPLPGAEWAPFAIAAGVGLLAAVAIALAGGPSRLDAAVAIDRAFRLNERLSTALTLPAAARATPAGHALMADALRHVAALDLGAHFGLRAPRRAWLPLIPAGLALLLVYLPGGWAQRTARADRVADRAEARAITQQTKALGKSIARRRKELEKDKLAEAEKLFAEIEKAADQLTKAPPAQKDKALVKLNELHDALKDRQKDLGGAEQVAKQLQQLKSMTSNGPADELAKALEKGDFAKAADELKKLQEQLAAGKLPEKDKQALKEQLGELKQKLEKLANQQERRKQLEEARKNGSMSKEQFDQQMAKLDQQAKDLKKLDQLAQKIGQAQNAMSQGDMKKAADALGMGQKDIEQMARQMKELESLNDAMADLQDAKDGMNGDPSNQLGNRFDGDDNGPMGMDGDPNANGYGPGGRGRGQGRRPEAKDATSSYNSKVRQQIGKGSAIQIGEAPPREQRKGDSVITVQDTAEAASAQSAEALSNQKVPNGIRKHISGYFDEIRKGH